MIPGFAPLAPLWPGSMTTTLRVMLPPPLALVVVLGGACVAEGDFVVFGGAGVDGGSTTTVSVTVAGSSETVVVGLFPLPAPGADVVLVTVTGPPPVPVAAVDLLLLVAAGFGFGDVVVAGLDVVLPGNGATVTCGPLDTAVLVADDEDDGMAEVTVVGGAATPVPQAAVSTAAAATMTRRCRARIRPRCHAGPPRRGRLGRLDARIAHGADRCGPPH